jgi:hypothetical protein
MQASDAHALLTVMHGEWPGGGWITEGDGPDAGDLTTRGTMYALTLADFDGEIAAEAIRRLRDRFPYRTGPQTADLKATLREVQAERVRETPVLLSYEGVPPCCRGQGFGHWYRDHADDDMRARVDALLVIPPRARPETIVLREAFARVVGGRN